MIYNVFGGTLNLAQSINQDSLMSDTDRGSQTRQWELHHKSNGSFTRHLRPVARCQSEASNTEV